MKRSNEVQKMKLTVIIAVIVLSLIIVIPAKAINWGEPDGNRHPNVGAIMGYFPDWGMFLPFCSGTLIEVDGLEGRVFLTAGHCTDGLEDYPDWIFVCFDEDPLDMSSTWLEVKEVVTHPEYNAFRPRSNNHDVGLLLLEEDAGIAPATLPDKGFLDEKKKARELRQGKKERDFIVVGYGGTLDWPPPSVEYYDKRQFAESEYQALTKSWLHMSQNHATGDGGTCYGDSGGPTFWVDSDGEETDMIVAITSWGDMSTVATGIAYRTDTSDVLDLVAQMADEWLE